MANEAPVSGHRTCEGLRLDLESAKAGRTWLLLPEEHRDQGTLYPLPTTRPELQRLVDISIPRFKRDDGCVYLRRARAAWLGGRKARIRKPRPLKADEMRRVNDAYVRTFLFNKEMKNAQSQMRAALDTVYVEAQAAVASLSELFKLGREGIEGQMRSHIEGKEWKDERITAAAFRDCFRMVTQAVKGLGLPSDQRAVAADTIMQEAADAIRETQDAVAMAPGTGDEKPQ